MSRAGVQKPGDWPLERASAGGGGRESLVWGVWYSEAAPQADTGTPPVTGERGGSVCRGTCPSGSGREEPPPWPRESKRVTGLGPGAQAPSLESQETPQEKAGLLE